MRTVRHLFECWNEFKTELSKKYVMLFLDYDGTLTPIAERPESAKLSRVMKNMLARLTLCENLSVSIVSGRSLEQLKELIGVSGLLYVGNHGFEIDGPGIRHIHPGAVETQTIMAEIFESLTNNFKVMPGIIIENKIYTLSVHYRQVLDEKVDRVRTLFLNTIFPFLDQAKVIFTEGKKVLEVRPALGWNKGTAVSWLFGRKLASMPAQSALPIYVGDDKTDEAALKAMRNIGIGIKINEAAPEASYAGYYLRNPEELYEFLERIQKLKNDNRKA